MSDKNQTGKPAQNGNNRATDHEAQIDRLSHAINKLADQITALTTTQNASNRNNSQKVQNSLPNSGAAVYDAASDTFQPVQTVSTPPLHLLFGIERAKNTLLENTQQFANGHSANNALLWGARGMGKSTLIKSIHHHLCESMSRAPMLIEVQRGDIAALPKLLRNLRSVGRRFILFCDDLSFNQPDRDFKALKTVLEGGLEGKPANIMFYATSNRRHLIPRTVTEQEAATGLHANETMDDVIALSDRFGLWLGFHACDQTDYLRIIAAYIAHFGLDSNENWKDEALNWAKTRGNRSGRTAWQFTQHLAGMSGKLISF